MTEVRLLAQMDTRPLPLH